MGQRLKTLAPYLLIIGLGILLYAPLLSYGFVDFDDSTLLLDHLPTFRDFSNLTKVFTHDFLTPVTSGYYYRPLLAASLILNAQFLDGTAPKIYHGFDIILHLLTAVLLFVLLQKLAYRRGASLIFLVHPLVLQTVAWIPARNDSLATIFVILAFITFLNFLEHRRVLIYIVHILFFLLAVLSKELTLLFPLLLLFYAKFIAKTKIRSLIPWFIGWAAAAALWYLLRSTVVSTTAFGLSSLIKSVYLNSVGVIIYLGKIILPFNLSTYPVFEDSNLFYGFASLAAVTLVIIFSKNKHWGASDFWRRLVFALSVARTRSP